MAVRLYVIPLSHPAIAARLMLAHKGIEHSTVEILAGLHPLWMRLAGFSRGTVPALRVDGRRVQGTLSISRFLDALQPDPPLFPADPEQRRKVEEAEAWGEAVLQDVPRRLFRWALTRDRGLRHTLAEINGMPFPGITSILLKPVAAYFAWLSGADDDAVRRDLDRLPDLLDRADAWVLDGVIGDATPNAAAFQIGPSLRLLLNFRQLEPLFANRPAARFARGLLPDYPASVPDVFPASWVPGS